MLRTFFSLAAVILLASACSPCPGGSSQDCINLSSLADTCNPYVAASRHSALSLVDRAGAAGEVITAAQRSAVDAGVLSPDPRFAQACSDALDARESGEPASLDPCHHLFGELFAERR